VEDGPASACIVGAGLFGVAAARVLSRRGIAFECFDRGAGTPAGRLDVSRQHLQLAGWPMPGCYPQLPSRRHLATYLGEYAERFGLSRCIRRGVEVRAAAPLPDGSWEIELRPGGRRRFAALLVAGGADRVASAPPIPGEFAGEQVFAADAAALRGRDVIVAGAGREACEIAVAASYEARSTRLSIRRAPHILPQIVLGRPLDRSPGRAYLLGKGLGRGRFTARLPRRLRRRLLNAWYRAWTAPELHGLPSPAGPPGEIEAVPAAPLLERLLHGRIEIRPAIERLAGDRVRFADGRSAAADLIVWCDGARRVSFLPQSAQPRARRQDDDPFFDVFSAAVPNLAFLGPLDPLGSPPAWLAEAQAKRVAARLESRR
jgi:cation diffusion facilitator CzcD-associated flavoprotein CzcO